LNNLVGLKPSCGRIPTTGVLPACRTLDVVSVFALTAGDAATVLGVAQGEDPKDAYSRTLPPYGHNFGNAASFRFGVPRPEDLAFHGNPDGPTQFAQAVAKLVALGGTPVEVDMTPFFAVAKLLYEGPWVAERYQAIRAFIEASPQALHPVTRAITEKGPKFSAPDTFSALYKLKDLERQTRAVWGDIDCLVTPTASTAYTIKAVEADPIALNSNLGHYTNYVNLLDLSAIAVPTGFMGTSMSNMPWGVTLVARAGQDVPLLSLAARLHASTAYTIKAVEADPIALNSNLGHYTNYVNLLDLSAIAVPTGFMGTSMSNMPWGVTLVARAGKDEPLLSLAARLHASTVATAGATPHAPHRLMSAQPDLTHFASGLVTVAVCGAHLSGLPLNWQLTQRGAKLLRAVRSAPCYKLFALPGGPPKRPGMLRVDEGGAAIDMEVWALAASEFGSFVAGIPAPLGIGTVLLEDGTSVQGFVCEAHATTQAQDISHFGGWRAYLSHAV